MPVAPPTRICPQCGTQVALDMTACPKCGWLVYGDHLAMLAQSAREAADRGDVSSALTHWREALVLLPDGSKQHQIISARITELDRLVPNAPAPGPVKGGRSSPLGKAAGGLGAIGLLLWKLKALFFGLGKMSTLFSMLLSMGVYWTLWGWPFAVGIVLSIYVHEMGHVIALRRYGFKATAPMFIPGLGALIRLQQRIVNPREDAEIGLAGPIYGLGAALTSAAIFAITKQPIFAAIAGLGAWINLFNLMPFGSLDGGRGFHAMSRAQKLIATAVVAGCWAFTHDGLLILVGLLCISRLFTDKDSEGSWKAAGTYVFLVIALTAVSMMRLHAPTE